MGQLAKVGKAAATIFVPIGLILAANAVAGREGALLVAVALFGVVGVGLLLAGVGRVRAWLRLRGSSATDPGGIDPGHVEVEGVARPLDGADPVEPPRAEDGAESLVYEHVVKKKQRSGDPDEPHRWETQTNETEAVPFVVEGNGGDVVVDPGEADLILEDSYSEEDSSRREYVRRIDPGEEVYVAGEAVQATDFDGDTDGRQYAVRRPSTPVPELLRRVYDEPFVVSDTSEKTAQRRLLKSGVKVGALALFYNAIYVGILFGLFG